MTANERQTEILEKAVSEAVEKALDPLIDDVHSIRRSINGEPREGNYGILARMERTERRVAILIWTIPVWVTAGTGLGQVLINVWNI